MPAAKVKLRIKSVKTEGTTFRQQAEWWREVLKHNQFHVTSPVFLPWVRNNWALLRSTMEEK